MLSKRTIIGLAIGSIIIGLAGYSLLDKLGPTISINEDFIIEKIFDKINTKNKYFVLIITEQ